MHDPEDVTEADVEVDPAFSTVGAGIPRIPLKDALADSLKLAAAS